MQKRMLMVLLVLLGAIAGFSGSLQARVLVYEGFDYEVGTKLETQSGGYGMTGNWLDIGGGYNGFAYIYDESPGTTQVGNDGGPLKWDGVVNNLPTSPAVGNRYISNGIGDGDKCASYRYLAQSAGAMAGDDGILWASVVWHAPGTGFGEHAGLALGTDAFSNRSVNFDASGSYGAGLGNGIGVGGAVNSKAITPVIYAGGAIAVRTTAGATNYVTSLDNIIVLKFEFGATDTVTAYTFTEDAELSEATFNANAVSATSTIDESTLNILTFSQVRGGNALDEIRIGDTFADVINPMNPSPAQGAVNLLGSASYPLSWTNIDPNTASGATETYVDVWFGTVPGSSDPLEWDKVVSGDAVSTVNVDASVAGTYYWQIDSYIAGDPAVVDYTLPSDPNLIAGSGTILFGFTVVDDALPYNVSAGDDIITWANEPVTLIGSYDDDAQSPVTVTWTSSDPKAVFSPSSDGGVTSNDVAPTVTVDYAAGNVTMTITVEDEAGAVSDTAIVEVYEDACKAARQGLGIFGAYDRNFDCVTDLLDLAGMAQQWLVDYSVTEPVYKTIQ